MLLYRAKRVATHARAKANLEQEEPEEKFFKITDSDLKITPEDSKASLKTLTHELTSSLLGIGKVNLAEGNQAAYGNPSQQVYMSYPTSEMAESNLRIILNDAIREVCDVHLIQRTGKKDKPSKEELFRMLDKATITLKPESLDKSEKEAQNESKAVSELYDIVFGQLKNSAKAWYDELMEYEEKKPEKIMRND